MTTSQDTKTSPYDPPNPSNPTHPCTGDGRLLTWQQTNTFISDRCYDALLHNVPLTAQSTELSCKVAAGHAQHSLQVAGCSQEDIDIYCVPAGEPGSREELAQLGSCVTPCSVGIGCFNAAAPPPDGYSAQCSNTVDWVFDHYPGSTNPSQICYLTKDYDLDNAQDVCRNYLLSDLAITDLASNVAHGGSINRILRDDSLDYVTKYTECSKAFELLKEDPDTLHDFNNNKCTTELARALCRTGSPTKPSTKPTPDVRCFGADFKNDSWLPMINPTCYQVPPSSPGPSRPPPDLKCYNESSKTECLKKQGCDWGANTGKSCANKIPSKTTARKCVRHVEENDCTRDSDCEWRKFPPTQGYTCWYDLNPSPGRSVRRKN